MKRSTPARASPVGDIRKLAVRSGIEEAPASGSRRRPWRPVVDVAALPVVSEPGPGAAVVEPETVSGSHRRCPRHGGLALRLRPGCLRWVTSGKPAVRCGIEEAPASGSVRGAGWRSGAAVVDVRIVSGPYRRR